MLVIPSFTLPTTDGRATFTISGTVTAQQSGTLQKITFNPTTIAANVDSACNTTATNPCRVEIIATSSIVDFPDRKPVGGYPAGVFMTGYFTGVQPLHQVPKLATGDTISMTAESSGVSDAAGRAALKFYVVNAVAAGDTGDTKTSLPASCSGSVGCKFIASDASDSFSTQIQETVQQTCDAGLPDCLTRLRTRVNVSIKTAGNSVDLPGGACTVPPPPPGAPAINQTALLFNEILHPLGNFNVGKLAVGSNDFAVGAKLTLPTGGAIRPDQEEVFLRVGDFTMTIPKNKFKRLLQGRLYTFVGKVGGRSASSPASPAINATLRSGPSSRACTTCG